MLSPRPVARFLMAASIAWASGPLAAQSRSAGTPDPSGTPSPWGGGVPLIVSPAGPFRSVQAAVDAAGDGDTVRVMPGDYAETVVIERPLTLIGEAGARIDGGGRGHVIEALAPVTIRGLAIRGSGIRVDEEHAGIMVRGATARILDNEVEDVLYGIYLKQAPGSEVRGNRVRGKPLAPPRRGDGIRLWQSPGSRVTENRVSWSRDVVIYFSDGLTVADNVVTDGRYGLHYMYSNDNRIERNRFERNEVGAFLMYSRRIELVENVFADSRGTTGIGLGLKDADEIDAHDNVIFGNGAGVHLDNSPSDVAGSNRFRENLLLLNDVGIRSLPSVRGNRIEGNEFVGNLRPAEVAGGVAPGGADQNRWIGNHWSTYAGFDTDHDGRGDTPYVHAKLADELLSREPRLAIFRGSPALGLLDLLARFFPLLEPEPILVDSTPQLTRAVRPVPVVIDRRPAPTRRWAGAGWAVLTLVAVGGGAAGARRRMGDA